MQKYIGQTDNIFREIGISTHACKGRPPDGDAVQCKTTCAHVSWTRDVSELCGANHTLPHPNKGGGSQSANSSVRIILRPSRSVPSDVGHAATCICPTRSSSCVIYEQFMLMFVRCGRARTSGGGKRLWPQQSLIKVGAVCTCAYRKPSLLESSCRFFFCVVCWLLLVLPVLLEREHGQNVSGTSIIRTPMGSILVYIEHGDTEGDRETELAVASVANPILDQTVRF